MGGEMTDNHSSPETGPKRHDDELGRLWAAIVENTKGDLFWIGEILLAELEKETGYKPHHIDYVDSLGRLDQ
jgi:hypothetical protein